MFKRTFALILLGVCFIARSFAGPADPSKFDPTPYKPQKALYDFNFAKPGDAVPAFAYIKNHIKAMKEFGDYKNSHVVIVAHGNELHAFSRLNSAAYPDMYKHLKELTDMGVTIRICANAARSRGYKPDEFYDLATVVPAAVIDIAKWQNEGYSYMYAEWFPRITREEILAQHPELKM
jgi:intracellular sulfur oxidation DsrE/DsrF family protein